MFTNGKISSASSDYLVNWTTRQSSSQYRNVNKFAMFTESFIDIVRISFHIKQSNINFVYAISHQGSLLVFCHVELYIVKGSCSYREVCRIRLDKVDYSLLRKSSLFKKKSFLYFTNRLFMINVILNFHLYT